METGFSGRRPQVNSMKNQVNLQSLAVLAFALLPNQSSPGTRNSWPAPNRAVVEIEVESEEGAGRKLNRNRQPDKTKRSGPAKDPEAFKSRKLQICTQVIPRIPVLRNPRPACRHRWATARPLTPSRFSR